MRHNLERLRSNPDLLIQYQAWLNSPMTQMVVGILESEGHPRLPHIAAITEHLTPVLYGEAAGYWKCLLRLQSLADAPSAKADVKADFGASKNLAHEFPEGRPGPKT